MVDEHDESIPALGAEVVLAAVPREDDTSRVVVENVGSDLDELMLAFGEEADVDAAGVVAIDEHDLFVRLGVDLLQHGGGEQIEGGSALRFDDAEDVGADVTDDHGGVFGGERVHVLGGELEPSDPARSAGGDDVDGAGPGAAEERAADLAQLHVGAGVGAEQPELFEEVKDVDLDRRCVDRLLEQVGELCVRIEDRATLLPRGQVHHARSVEQVLDVERSDSECHVLRPLRVGQF